MSTILAQKMTRVLAFRLLQMSVKNLSVSQPTNLTCAQRESLRKSIKPRTFNQNPTSFMISRNIHNLSASVFKLTYCLTKFWNNEKIGSGIHLQRRHLSSESKDGDEDEETCENETEELETEELETEEESNKDDNQDAKLRATQQFQSMHQLLNAAQVRAPMKDFDFTHVPQSTKERHQQTESMRRPRPKLDSREMTVFLFPGQGTQFVGMGRNLLQYPNVQEMYSVASDILGYDLLDLSLNGSEKELNRTVHCQPAILVSSLAAVEKLREEQPKAVENCVSAAGFSVGEVSALVFGGALTFEDAVELIKVRAEAMQLASDLKPGGMLSVIGRPGARFKMMCREATESCLINGVKEPVCSVAAHLFPEAKVIAGHTVALDFIQEMMSHYSLRMTKRMPVSGAFHSALMDPAKNAFYEAIDNVPIEAPLINLHANVNGKIYRHAKHTRSLLKRQLLEPVHWEQIMHEIYQRPKGGAFPKTYEVGPGTQLGGFLKKNNLKAYHSYFKVDV